jgi:hypothetical protein
MRISPWARRAMSSEASAIADRLHFDIVADSPSGPFALRHPKLTRREGRNIDALVLAAALELTHE